MITGKNMMFHPIGRQDNMWIHSPTKQNIFFADGKTMSLSEGSF